MVDRQTGSVIGIIWTGKIPKAERIKDSDYLDRLLNNPTEEIWTELSYAVPAVKIAAHLQGLIEKGELSEEGARIIEAMLP